VRRSPTLLLSIVFVLPRVLLGALRVLCCCWRGSRVHGVDLAVLQVHNPDGGFDLEEAGGRGPVVQLDMRNLASIPAPRGDLLLEVANGDDNVARINNAFYVQTLGFAAAHEARLTAVAAEQAARAAAELAARDAAEAAEPMLKLLRMQQEQTAMLLAQRDKTARDMRDLSDDVESVRLAVRRIH
jgi:hypothetical protein